MSRTIGKAFPWIILIHLAFFIAFWLTNASFYSYTNDYLGDLLGARIDYVTLCLLLSAALSLWTAARLGSRHSSRRLVFSPLTRWLYAVVALVYLMFFYGTFWLLLRESPVQLPRLGQMLLYFRIVLDPVLLLALTLVGALWLKRRLIKQTAGARARAILALPLVVPLAVIWSLMLMFPPDAVYRGVFRPSRESSHIVERPCWRLRIPWRHSTRPPRSELSEWSSTFA